MAAENHLSPIKPYVLSEEAMFNDILTFETRSISLSCVFWSGLTVFKISEKSLDSTVFVS